MDADWRADYWQWVDTVRRHGLPARIVGVELLPEWDGDRLLAIVLDVSEAALPLSNAARGFCLHVSLAFLSEMSDAMWTAAACVQHRYAGQCINLQIEWIGRGGAAMIDEGDVLASDADVVFVHSRGFYAERQLHVSL
jgi:hypothetical protein